jgi:Family of unknown function (DUF6677)
LKNPAVAVVLAWLFPGLGHAYLGRRKSGLLYALIVMAAFVMGVVLRGRLYNTEPGHPLTLLATFACYGAGLLNLAARAFLDNPGGDILVATYEYGCTFILTAGLMNLLLMLDAYDIATGVKG